MDFKTMLSEDEQKTMNLEQARYRVQVRLHAEMSNFELLVNALHAWHNSEITRLGVLSSGGNRYEKHDVVYDASLVLRIMPRMMIRMLQNEPGLSGLVEDLEEGREVKCPCPGCTGYVRIL